MGVPPTAEQSDLRNLIGSTGWVPFFSKYAPVLKVSLTRQVWQHRHTAESEMQKRQRERDQSSRSIFRNTLRSTKEINKIELKESNK